MSDTISITPAELALEPVVRVAPDTPIAAAARLLVAASVDTLVVDTVRPTEITEHDVVRAFADGVAPDTSVADCARETTLFVDRRVTVDRIVDAMLRARRHNVIVVDADGDVLGRLTLAAAISVLLDGPPWLGALRVALRIEGTVP